MKETKVYKKALLNIFVALLIIALLIFFVPKLLGFFMPFVLGWIIAMIANPLVRFMEKRIKIVRKHSSVIIIIGVLAAVIALLYFLGLAIFRESVSLVQDMPRIISDLETQLQSASKSLESISKLMPEQMRNFFDHFGENLLIYIQTFLDGIKIPAISAASSFAKNVADIFFMTIMTILSSYFFIAERESLITGLKKYTPAGIQDKFLLITQNFKKAIGGYFKAQIKIMMVVILIIFVGMEILKVKYSFLVAIGISFIDFLPIFGTGLIFWPWAAIDFLTGNYMEAISIMVIYIVCQIVRQILQPKMVGDSIGLSPLMTLFFMYVGYKIKGLLGLILGIPIGMVLINFYRAGVFDGILKSIKLLLEDINEYRKM